MLTVLLFAFFTLFAPPFASAASESGVEIDVGVNVDNGRFKTYILDLTWEPHSPDGYSRHMLLVNGESPGPVMRFEQDDWVVVHVVNRSPFNTTIHFHGIEMEKTPWSDGVPGVSQRPIAPAGTFTYKFRATQYGSYWYHSHVNDQIEDGLYGSILINPRPGTPKPFHMISDDKADVKAMERAERNSKPLALYDFMHITSHEKWDITPRAGIEIPCYDSILFNGKGRVQCLPVEEMMGNLMPVAKADLALVPGSKLTDKGCLPAKVMAAFGGNLDTFNASAIPNGIFENCIPTNTPLEIIHAGAPLSKSNWIALDILGATNFVVGVFSIDEHDMWIYAVDGTYIEPQKVQAITIANGERYSVFVRSHKAGDFKIRFNAVSAPQTINGYAILSVDGKNATALSDSKPSIDIIGNPITDNVVFFNETIAHPYPPLPISQTADSLFILNMRLDGASYLWALNSTRLQPNELDHYAPPMLFDKQAVSVQDNVTMATKNNTWVDLILFSSVTPMPPHPIHKHGVKMYLIGSGTGEFRWNSVEEAMEEIPGQFNLVNPPQRDTFVSHPARKEVNWIAVRYHSSNPGAWLLHCHISNHMMGGMMMVIMDGVDTWPEVPVEYLYHT